MIYWLGFWCPPLFLWEFYFQNSICWAWLVGIYTTFVSLYPAFYVWFTSILDDTAPCGLSFFIQHFIENQCWEILVVFDLVELGCHLRSFVSLVIDLVVSSPLRLFCSLMDTVHFVLPCNPWFSPNFRFHVKFGVYRYLVDFVLFSRTFTSIHTSIYYYARFIINYFV